MLNLLCGQDDSQSSIYAKSIIENENVDNNDRKLSSLSINKDNSIERFENELQSPYQYDFTNSNTDQAQSFLITQKVDISNVDPSNYQSLANSQINNMNFDHIKKEIIKKIDNLDHDDGSYAPLQIRLAWHCCATQDKYAKNGGSNGGTMRLKNEQNDPENKGLVKAINLLNPIKDKYPWITQADLYIQAGYVAFEHTLGPKIPFSYGRKDYPERICKKIQGHFSCPFGDGKINPNKSRLPPADLGKKKKSSFSFGDSEHCEIATINGVRRTFDRLDMDDKETVLLITMGHQYGRCHPDVSGQVFAWYSIDPTEWNAYENGQGQLSLQNEKTINKMKETVTMQSKRQFNLEKEGFEPFMMLPVDMALWADEEQKEIIEYYNANRLEQKKDAALAWKKLTELGCTFLQNEKINTQ